MTVCVCGKNIGSLPACPFCRRGIGRKAKAKKTWRSHAITETTRHAGHVMPYVAAEAQRQKCLAAVKEAGELTRDGIEAITGLKSQTITWRVSELIQSKQLIELQRTALTRSRRPARLLVLPDRAEEERTLF